MESPLPVPLEFWIRCMPPTAADRPKARRTHGPHADRYILVYGNDAAANATTKRPFPVGAVLVKDDAIIAEGFNQPIGACDPTAHAEMLALRAAGQRLRNYRMPGTTLYVTLEPCAMCASAMVHARVQRLVYGATDPRAGAAGSIFNIAQHAALNHRLDVTRTVLGDECGALLREFFVARR